MNESNLQNAVDDIAIIKGVIERTRKSFEAFAGIFIGWGIIAVFSSIANVFMESHYEALLNTAGQYPVISLVYPLTMIALAALVYFLVSRKIPLVGLEKTLMKIWMLILIMNMLPPRISIISPAMDLPAVVLQYNDTSGLLFSLAIGLITTALLTEYRQFMYIGAGYILFSLFGAYAPWNDMEASLFPVLNFVAMPFAFLYAGYFLKSRQARGMQIGY